MRTGTGRPVDQSVKRDRTYFTFTNYEGFDPEWADAQVGDGTGGVSSRTYQVGVNLKF